MRMIEIYVSDCCGSEVYAYDLCSDCHEHCERVLEAYPDRTDPEYDDNWKEWLRKKESKKMKILQQKQINGQNFGLVDYITGEFFARGKRYAICRIENGEPNRRVLRCSKSLKYIQKAFDRFN